MSNVSELLHKEIWTKRTSHIIALVALSFCCIALLWAGWTTPREKRLARVAIEKADRITDPESLSQAEFDVKYADAMKAAANAKDSAITLQDQTVAMLAELYVFEVRTRRVIWLLPDAKMGKGSSEIDRDVTGREQKLLWIARDTEAHEKFRVKLVSIVGNTR
ncbi:MAG: hypothetical protein JWQ49_3256 [Edaphobacter sp.]|nr:hypothetical protein [Edaphobacter sp.]